MLYQSETLYPAHNTQYHAFTPPTNLATVDITRSRIQHRSKPTFKILHKLMYATKTNDHGGKGNQF